MPRHQSLGQLGKEVVLRQHCHCSLWKQQLRGWGKGGCLLRNGLPLQDRVQADDLVKMLFSPEEVDIPQPQPLHDQQGSPKPGDKFLSDRQLQHKDEL